MTDKIRVGDVCGSAVSALTLAGILLSAVVKGSDGCSLEGQIVDVVQCHGVPVEDNVVEEALADCGADSAFWV